MSEEKKKYKKTSYSFKDEHQLLNFGQFEGKPIGEVMKSNPDYIEWCVENFKGFKLWKKLEKRFEEIKKENEK
jgi:hypothetical protein